MGYGCLSGPLQKDRFLTLHGPVLQEPDGDDVSLGEIVDVSDGLTFVSGQGYAVLVEPVPLVGADDDDIRSHDDREEMSLRIIQIHEPADRPANISECGVLGNEDIPVCGAVVDETHLQSVSLGHTTDHVGSLVITFEAMGFIDYHYYFDFVYYMYYSLKLL